MNPTVRLFLALGAFNALVAVAAGAFGAHGLKARVAPELLAVFETGARYHMYHSLGLFAVALMATLKPGGLVAASGWSMLAGILLFSGSLYAMTLSGVRALGMITPVGGFGFLIGWLLLGIAAVRG